MTKSTPNPSPNPERKKPSWSEQLLQKIASSPKKVTIGIGAIAACGFLGYWGIDYLVKKKLAPLLESQIGKIIARPIDWGEVKGFSFNSIEFGPTSLPAKATDKDRVSVEKIKVKFNILPVIFHHTLPLDISLIQPDVYLEQEKDGEWLNLDFLQSKEEKKESLIFYDVTLDVEQADITAMPYNQSPIEVQVNGNGSYEGTGEQLLTYDLDAAIDKAKTTIKGKTRLASGQTNTKLLVKDLALANVSSLLSNSPVSLNRGVLNANLDVNLPSFKELIQANVQGQLSIQNIAEEVTSKSKLREDKKESLSTKNINNTQSLIVWETAFRQVKVNFQADLNKAIIENLQITPVAGGEVTANGTITINIKQALEQNQHLDVTNMPLAFDFQAQLPTEELVNSYYQIPAEYQIGNFNATGKIDGTINNLKGVVDWQLPAANTAGVEDIAGEGKLLLAGEEIRLKDTKIAVGTATAGVTGKANLTNKQWQANVDAEDISSSLSLAKFASENLAFLEVDNINVQIDLNGSINWTFGGKLAKNHH